MRPSRSEAAVSDVLGSILLVGITVVMAAGFGLVLLSYDGPSDTQHTQVSVTVGPGSNGVWGVNEAELMLRHIGGEALRSDDVTVRYTLADGTTATVTPTFPGGTLTLGQTWTQAITAQPGDAIQVFVIVSTGRTAAVLSGGVASAGGAAGVLTYVATITPAAGWGTAQDVVRAQAANDDLYAVLSEGPVGGVVTAGTRSPTSTTNLGATNPGNVLASDNARATLDAAAEYVQAAGFSAHPGAGVVGALSIGFEGLATQTCSTVSHVAQVNSGETNSASSVSTGTVSIAVGDVYLAAVAVSHATAAPDVIAVSGLTNVQWTQVAQVATLDNTGRVEAWIGTPTGLVVGGSVTATTASSFAKAAIGVMRYSGVDAASPIEASTTNAGTGNAWSTAAIAGTATNGRFVGVANGMNTGSVAWVSPPESSQRFDRDVSNVLQLAVSDAAAAATNAGSATLTNSPPWAAIGLTLRPSCTALPTVQLAYYVSGVAAGSPQSFQLTAGDVSNTISIITDRTWAVADIANIAVRVTVPAVASGSTAAIDHIFLALTTSDVPTTYRFDAELVFNGVPTGTGTEVVQLRYKANGADSFKVSVWDGSTTDGDGTGWDACPGLLNAVTFAVHSCILTASHHAGADPNVRVRIEDNNPGGATQGILTLDYARVSTA